tara:strand:- start:112 stop:363 length:252 start_codon:yes stop_codon:yes gene_type:complete
MKYLSLIFIVTIIFIIHVENSVGGILLRNNSEGIKVFNFSSLFNFLIHPFHNRFLWNIKLLDINYPFVIGITTFFYYFKKIVA